ncbi:hypothetical protein FRC11_004145, partial [Ceratobasidium sp. 423]
MKVNGVFRYHKLVVERSGLMAPKAAIARHRETVPPLPNSLEEAEVWEHPEQTALFRRLLGCPGANFEMIAAEI